MDTGRETEGPLACSWTVGGIDCASCAGKIRGALERLPGVSKVQVSVVSNRLTLNLSGSATAPEEIEEQVRRLGYSVARRGGDGEQPRAGDADILPTAHGPEREHGRATGSGDEPWYRTGKGRLVILTGTLLAAAWGAKL